MDPFAEQEAPPPPPRRNGCLWGCIGLLIASVIVVLGVFTYGAWYFYHGFDADPRIQLIMDTVRHDRQAEAVLGHNIKLLEVHLHTFDYSTGRGGTASYELKLAGSDSEGDLKADLDVSGGDTKIKLLVLTGKDGRVHYLVGKPPPNPLMQNSI